MNLRDLPSIDRLMRSTAMDPVLTRHGPLKVKARLREIQSDWRESGAAPDWAADEQRYADALLSEFAGQGYRPVFNLTGTIIHTNLGRALISDEIFESVRELVTRPMNLEYDLAEGKRGDRDKVVEDKLKALTGAEAATVVNNGAAALMLVLNTLALGKGVPVSRGELIEIGGSFRLPDIMERSGCRLIEVGTTNRTHLRDYENALSKETSLLLKVHPSNYHVGGFTNEVTVRELSELATARELPVCLDLGSGTLVDLSRFGLPHEPTPSEALSQGADLVTFSGDKLLGGTQAGIILGQADLIEALKRNPMKRALRADKYTLAILEKTLTLYEYPDELAQRLPLLQTLTTATDVLTDRAQLLQTCLQPLLPGYSVLVSESHCQIGSGSLPDQRLESRAVKISHTEPGKIRKLLQQLRHLPEPVIGRIQQDSLWLDMRGAERMDSLVENLSHLSIT